LRSKHLVPEGLSRLDPVVVVGIIADLGAPLGTCETHVGE
jgi:hypothetical protein